MEDWRELARQYRFEEIRFLDLPPIERPELLGWLRSVVPITSDEDGIERQERYARPSEISDEKLHEAARILALGELQASISGEPAEDSQHWTEERELVEQYLEEFIGEEPVVGSEVTPSSEVATVTSDLTGLRDPIETALRSIVSDGVQPSGAATPLSQRAHAEACLENFRLLDVLYAQMSAQLSSDQEQVWLREIFAGVALLMLDAGRRLQAVWHKPHEVDTLRGKHTKQSASEGGKGRTGKLDKWTEERLEAMRQEIRRQHQAGEKKNLMRAARKAAKIHGSVNANYAMLKEYRKVVDLPAKSTN